MEIHFSWNSRRSSQICRIQQHISSTFLFILFPILRKNSVKYRHFRQNEKKEQKHLVCGTQRHMEPYEVCAFLFFKKELAFLWLWLQ